MSGSFPQRRPAMRTRPPRRFSFSTGVALLASLLVVGAARAQPQPSRDVGGPAAAGAIGAGLDLTIASLQARIKQLEAAQAVPDDSTAEALREYGAAIEQLAQAAEWKARADALARLQREGPQLLESTRTEIEAWSRPTPTTTGSDVSQDEVEAQLAETEAKLAVFRKGLLDVDAEQARLAERRLALPAELAAAGATGEGLLGEFALPPLPTGSVETALARRAADLARQKATVERISALELEIATQEMRRELMTVRRDLFRRKADAYAVRITELQGALTARRLREAEDTAAAARVDQASLARVHPILGALAEENAGLAAERTGSDGLSAKIDETARHLSSVADQLQRLEERSKGVRQKVTAAGLTDAIGLLLRKERADLPHADRARADIRARREQIAAAQFQALNLEDLLKALPVLETEVEEILSSQTESLSSAERGRIEATARNVLKTRRSYLDILIRDYNSWFASLLDLDARQNQLVALIEDYGAFLDQHVLWIPNASLPTAASFRDWRGALQWLVDPSNHLGAARRLAAAARSAPLSTGAGLLLILAALAYRRRLKALLAEVCQARRTEPGALMPAPVTALLLTALLALPGPFVAAFVGWMLRIAPTPPDDFSRAVATVLGGVASPLFAGEFLRRATGKNGLASAFLDWPRAALGIIRSQVVLIETVALPAFAISLLFDVQSQNDWSETLGRGAFCLGVGAAGLGIHRMIARDDTVMQQVLRRTDLQWLGPLLARLAWVPALGAAAIIVISLVGYYYTASVLVERLWLSSIVVLVFVVVNASTLRWLEAKQEEAPTDDEAAEVSVGGVVSDDASSASAAEAISHVSAQTRSLLRVSFGIGLVVALFSVWVDVFPALRFFEKVELWQVSSTVEKTVGAGDAARVEMVPTQVPVTVTNLLVALLGVALAILGARNLPGVLELVLLSRLKLDRGLRYAIAAVTRYAVFVIGAVIAFENLGVGWSNVQWMVAAVSVGLGFGLQEIFGNFVSGLIVLFERPVRVGDTVTIDGVTGTVSRIEMRATTLVDGDRKELIVPNKSLITGKLVNWSLHDPIVRLVVPVSVAFGTDTAAVGRVLQEAAKQCATVLETPPPQIVLRNFGSSGLEYDLRVFVVDPDHLGPTRHELLTAIERKFRAAGIQFPSTHQDVHLVAVDAAAASALAGRGGDAE